MCFSDGLQNRSRTNLDQYGHGVRYNHQVPGTCYAPESDPRPCHLA